MECVNIKIDGKDFSVPENYTVLDAARENGIHIPTLCYLKDSNEIGACRFCLVEVVGTRSLQASCVYPVSEGLEVYTSTPVVLKARKDVLELILSNHDARCYICKRNGNCELRQLAEELNVSSLPYEGENIQYKIDDLSPAIVRDNNKCIVCRRCVSACQMQGISVIQAKGRGFATSIGSIYDKSLADVACINCGQCIEACPTGALYEKDHTARVWKAINDPDRYVVFQTAPAVRAALGEEFGLPIGTAVTGKMVAAIRRLGADKVFDTDTGADFTIMEEGYELLDRLNNGGTLPMITSCSPGWVKYCEQYYPEFIPNLSSCKSPHMMLGAITKTYYAEKVGIDPQKIYNVSVMPCIAKKYEIDRPEMEADGLRDVDAVLTTRELARMIKEKQINFVDLPEEGFDAPYGEATGAGVIFGASGGVMEAALRTVGSVLKGENLSDIEFTAVRGQGRKEFKVKLPKVTLKGVVVSGTAAAKEVLEDIKAGRCDYQFIEVMGCPGGCVVGGGQPIVSAKVRAVTDVFGLRAAALYDEDKISSLRMSHDNPFVKTVYREFLEKPNSEKAHHLFHTSYQAKEKMVGDLLGRPTFGPR